LHLSALSLHDALPICSDLRQGHAEHLSGGGAVNILTGGEGLQQTLVARQVRHDAQLNLRIIGGDDAVTRWRDECLPDASTFGGADRKSTRLNSSHVKS